MNKNNRNIKYRIIVCVFILFFFILIIGVLANKEYTNGKSKSSATEEISMSIIQINSSEKSIKSLQKNNHIEVEFEFPQYQQASIFVT